MKNLSTLAVNHHRFYKKLADIASIHMKFKSGIKSDIRVSWINPLKEVKLVVIGKFGMLVFDDTKNLE